jgi:FkbM family methyltransferase
MNTFRNNLAKKLVRSQSNNYGIDNFDEHRFGKFPSDNANRSSIFKIIRVIKKIIPSNKRRILNDHTAFLEQYENRLQKIYANLDINGQKLIVDLIAYQLLGYKKVKLSRNNKEYRKAIKITNSLVDGNETYDPHFLHFILQKYDLRKIGYDIKLFYVGLGVITDFIFEQYAYKSGNKRIVAVEEGDVVLDLGACWGETALYFACKTGKQGKVFSFEFIPDNVKVFNMNIALNPNPANRIKLIQHPVSDKSGDTIYFINNGPGSKIEFEPFDGQTGSATTISIDDFVKNNSITKVDFIKMDIEGSEPLALKGAIETIKRFKPKLAIAIYHTMDDFVNIPDWIAELNLGYKLHLCHYTIHSEESIIFATVKE